MLIHVGQDRGVAFDLRLAIWLALAAGAVNAAGFRSLGYFSANMTGNVSTLTDMLALGRIGTALWLLALLVSFILGALVSALLIEAGQARRIRGIYAYSILLEAALLVAMAVLDSVLASVLGGHLMLVGLSFVMGLQNATSTRISDGRVRTSHVSGVATDIGIELAQMLLTRDAAARRVVQTRLVLHGATLGAFALGGVAGVLAYGWIGGGVFALVAALLLVLAIPELGRARRSGPQG